MPSGQDSSSLSIQTSAVPSAQLSAVESGIVETIASAIAHSLRTSSQARSWANTGTTPLVLDQSHCEGLGRRIATKMWVSIAPSTQAQLSTKGPRGLVGKLAVGVGWSEGQTALTVRVLTKVRNAEGEIQTWPLPEHKVDHSALNNLLS